MDDRFRFVVVGAGIAGLRAAVDLAAVGTVLVVAKKDVTDSATQYAQGGVAVAWGEDDEIGLHYEDTLAAGDGLCNPKAVQVLVEDAPKRIEELIAWGAEFDRAGNDLALGKEAAHSRSRIVHAHGDSTGREIARALYEVAKKIPNIRIEENEFAADLIVQDGEVCGVSLMNEEGQTRTVQASAVLLATGGLGQVYSETTNPSVATGDGVAMAFRAGAELSDLEFVQFHPTALYLKNAPRFLLSEAMRGEGALLLNERGERFMPRYHAMAELAPRDVVARAIAEELRKSIETPQSQVSAQKDAREPGAPVTSGPAVYLDIREKGEQFLAKRFPRIYETCLQYGINIGRDLIPVRPAAHYAMGGVRTDLDGRTSVRGLYAAGEVACTGVHGANRLASNSLLEGLVFGARAAKAMRERIETLDKTLKPQPVITAGVADVEPRIRRVREIMWRDVGIVRSGEMIARAIGELEQVLASATSEGLRARELRNMAQTGLLIAQSALAREESRGAQYRTDFPQHDDEKYRKHSVVKGERVTME